MYCILQHNQYLNESSNIFLTKSEPSDTGLNVTLYFNPNCILQLILDYIYTKTNVNIDGENYDICNLSGELLGVKDYKINLNGLAIFQPRETYFIVYIKRNEIKTKIEEISPLLDSNSSICQTLKKNIKHRHFPRKSSLIKRGSSSRQSLAHSIHSNH